MLKYMLNYIPRACEVITIWSVGYNLTFDVHEKVFIECSLHCLFNIRYAFFYICHNPRLHMLKNCGMGKKALFLELNAIFANHDFLPYPLPHFMTL